KNQLPCSPVHQSQRPILLKRAGANKMAKLDISTKRLAITKANGQTVIFVAVAAFVTVFCLVATQALWTQNAYERKVVSAKEKANRQLKSNIAAVNTLMDSYKKFVDTP